MFFLNHAVDIASYPDDNTLYNIGRTNVNWKINYKRYQSNVLNGSIEGNQDKCHSLSSLEISTEFSLTSGIIENSGFQKLLGITSDKKLNFNERGPNLCDNANKNIQALIRIFPCVLRTRKRHLTNGFFMTQLGYYPLAWVNTQQTYERITQQKI